MKKLLKLIKRLIIKPPQITYKRGDPQHSPEVFEFRFFRSTIYVLPDERIIYSGHPSTDTMEQATNAPT